MSHCPHLLAWTFHPGILHILLILSVNGRGSESSRRQKEMMVFQLLCLLRAASRKLVFAEVNYTGNSLQFQDLKLAATSLILMKLLQIHSDIIKAKFGLKTVNLSNDEWILLCGYMAVNQGAISSIQKTGFEMLWQCLLPSRNIKRKGNESSKLFPFHWPPSQHSSKTSPVLFMNFKVSLFFSGETVPFCQISLFQRKTIALAISDQSSFLSPFLPPLRTKLWRCFRGTQPRSYQFLTDHG